MKILKLTICAVILCLVISSLKTTQAFQLTEQKNEPKEVWITIFVHGIISIKPHLNIPTIVRIMRNTVDDTIYKRSIELIRDDPFFYQYHTMQKPGLYKIDPSHTCPGAASVAFAKAYEQIIQYTTQKHTKNYYYTFGWSGLLNQQARYLDAIKFYDALEKELDHYFSEKIKPKIRIIGYSHGANLALELAQIDKEKKTYAEKRLSIEELILIGAPLLPESSHLIYGSIFKKIYHFYSSGDRVQQMDFFSAGQMVSRRSFKRHNGFALPENLIQVKIQIKRPIKGKESFCRSENRTSDNLIPLIPYRALRTADPGHSELWSFGWVPYGYRKNMPLYPLPFAAYTPYLIASLYNYQPDAKKVSLELHPYAECMVLRNLKTSKKTMVPFLTKEQHFALQKIVEPYRPLNFTEELFDGKIEYYKNQAHREWLSKHKICRFGHYRIV
jgi:pimeloyl-ACP methyl ester carboxylesterase